MKVASALAVLVLASTPSVMGELLPQVSVQLSAARYVPTRTDFVWQGWIGAGATVVRVRDTSAYFTADVETIIGDTLRTIDPNQANYHLEAGLQHRVGPGTATIFFHHVSRHYVDRPKTQAVDWNVLGAQIAWPIRSGPRPVHVTASLGHTTVTSLVGYRWEASAEVDAEPARIGSVAVFGRGGVRVVTVDPDPALPRGSFADAYLEGGARFRRDGRALDLFAAVEQRNDVYLEMPGRLNRALFGFRISYLN